MDSSPAIYYCCVCNGSEKLQSFNNGDSELESLAELCLQNAPSLHAHYSHTMGQRTYTFLMEDGNTYFAISSSKLSSTEILRFLEKMRDGFKNASLFDRELVPVIRQLIASLENVARTASSEQTPERAASSDRLQSTNTPLLGKDAYKHDSRKLRDFKTDSIDVSENYIDRGIKIDIPPESTHGISLQKSSSMARERFQSSWCYQVKFIILIDFLLCIALFGVWLAVCNGFQCVSDG